MACAMFTQAQAAVVYSLGSDGTELVRFDSATPASVTTVGTISGGPSRLDGLDFRPSNGLLYGYSDLTQRAYIVDTNTGAVTLAANLDIPTNTNFLGLDFNPVADRLRIVTNSEQNLRVNVGNGVSLVDTPLAYAAADANFGADPSIIDAAYTNSALGSAFSTRLYYLDYDINSLVTSSNPNAGLLSTVGLLGVDFDANAGFDIYTNNGTNSAFGALRVGGVTGLYSINLATGAASLVGAIGDGSDLFFGLAVVPGNPVSNVVSEPGSLALMTLAGLAALTIRRRQRAATTRAA